MKKILTYATILLIVAIISVSGTYAFFAASVSTEDPISGTAHHLEVRYNGDEEINGGLELVTDKSEGHRREVSIALAENSIDALANIYIYIDQISPGLASEALVWEVYTLENGVEVKYDEGSFVKCGKTEETKAKCSDGDKNYLVTNYKLSTTSETFVIYLWLNAMKSDNSVLDGKLKGYIGAETENITGLLQ